MPEVISVLTLPGVHRPAEVIVAKQGSETVDSSRFLASVQTWRNMLEQQKGQGFALYVEDGLTFAAALIGAWHAGKTVYVPSDALPGTCDALKQVVDGFIGDFPVECKPLRIGEECAYEPSAWLPLSPDFVGVVVYTSGSTGTPQAIPKRLGQLAAEVATLERLFGELAGRAELAATVSHQHIYGLLFKILWPLTTGRVFHATSFTYPEELVPITTAIPTILISSPALLARMPHSSAWQNASHQIDVSFSSGGPLSEDAAFQMKALTGNAPIEVFGSSETGGIAYRQRGEQMSDVWTVMPGIEWRLGEGEVMEIRSPHLFDESWYRTSDCVEEVDERRFLLKGRADRLVKIAEKRISLDAVERSLMTSSWVAQARVVTLEEGRMQLAAYVVLNQTGREYLAQVGKAGMNAALRVHLSSHIERVGLPRRWHYIDAMPVNAQGKTTVALLRASTIQVQDVSSSTSDVHTSARRQPTMPSMRLLHQDECKAGFELWAAKDLLYFEGHFAGTPILPGVVQVDWAIALGRQCFRLPSHFVSLHALKFQRVIQPEQLVRLELEHDTTKGSLSFRYTSTHGQHASGRIVFEDGDV